MSVHPDAALHGVCDRIAQAPVATELVRQALVGWDRIEPFTDLESLS